MLPIIALVGRPNTGKSTLFNRLVGSNQAITSDIAGTTRDRVYRHATIATHPAIVIDTGGLNFQDANDNFDQHIAEQAKLAIEEADIIVQVIDASEPLLANDTLAAKIIRKTNKPIFLVANKSDRKASDTYTSELHQLGFKNIYKIAAITNQGISTLKEGIGQAIKSWQEQNPKAQTKRTEILKIGFIGKPNVGKSSLVNKLLGKEQVIVSDISGTTRDSTHLDFAYGDQKMTFVDTAGIRRRGKQKGIERYGVFRTLKTIDEIDVALLIIDGEDGLAKQDMHVSEFILDATKGMAIIVNKADLLKPEQKNRLLGILQSRMQYVPWAPVIFTSAITGTNITKLLDISLEIHKERKKRVGTSELNFYMRKMMLEHPPAAKIYKSPKITFVTQAETVPPTFIFFCKNKNNLHFSYKRYLENKIREAYGFNGTCIKMLFKEGSSERTAKPKPKKK